MPFKKRKAEKEQRVQQANDAHREREQQFEADIRRAEQITDPAQRILALREVESRIFTHIEDIKNGHDKAAYKNGRTLAAGIGSGAAGGAATGIFGGPIGLALCVPAGMIAGGIGVIISVKQEDAVRKKLEDSTRSHTDRLRVQAGFARVMADDVIENNVEEISKSPLLAQVKGLPGNSMKFAKAAAKHMAAKDTAKAKKPETDEASPSEEAPTKLRLKKPGNNQL